MRCQAWACCVAVLWGCVRSAAGCWPLFDVGGGGQLPRGPNEESARAAKAPVIAVGVVERTYKKLRDSHQTYSIDFRIARVLKGKDIVNALQDTHPDSARNVYRISNFGIFKWCFSDVHDNQTYVLFLQAYGGRLSAFYTRVVDAAEVWSSELEERLILQTQGYKSWGEWSGCSATCGGGVLRRTRVCARDEGESACTDDNVEKKECNAFACSGVKNLVEVGGLPKMNKGVIRYNGTGAGGDARPLYDVTPNFYGQVPAALLYKPRWPIRYSVIVRVRPRETRYPRQGQYLFSLADTAGEQYVGLKLYPCPTLELRTASGSEESVPVSGKLLKNGHRMSNINDGDWHSFAFGVDGGVVTSYYGCFKRAEVSLRERPSSPNVHASSVVLATRMYKMDRGAEDRFEGTIDQLLITDDPNDADRQCSTKYWSEKVATKAKNYPRQNDSPCMDPDDEDCAGSGDGRPGASDSSSGEHWEWSVWSPCSRTCGTGKKTRTPYCLQNSINREDCIPYYVPAVHVKECVEQRRCPECNCQNGGLCISDWECKCPKGWTGPTCSEPVCSNGCRHGNCVAPDVCECHSGWTGAKCETPFCYLVCQNGGTCASPNTCHCPDGYGGPLCSRLVRACSSPCLNGGRCSGLDKCECREGFRGRFCQEKAEPRCSRACLNGGSCISPGDKCACAPGYRGDICESDVCGGCRNRGRCDPIGKTCSCEAGFAGAMCEYAVMPTRCLGSARCLNGGSCVDFNTCHCPPGYHGQQCQVKKCSSYRTTRVTKEVPIRKAQYRYYRCPGSVVTLCKQFSGYTYERKNLTSQQVDLSQCDD